MNDRTELERLLAEWHERSDPAGADAFIAAHPEHADALRKHLGVLDLVGHAFEERPTLPEMLGPFRIEEEIGSGGMGSVYRAVVAEPVRGIATGRTVALKVVHPHLFRTQGFFKRFLREAELGQRIEHPNVVRTLDADAVEIDDRPQHYLVMEYVEGQTLRELVEDVDRVPEELARHIGCEVAKALSAIHAAGAVHRDLKPENVLITEDHQIKVMDLGVARLVDEQMRLSQTGAFVGSLHYAAPEQFGGGADIDFRADLHGLGLLLYEIATGTNPFADEDARVVMRRIISDAPRKVGELNPQLSPFFEEVVSRLLEKDAAERFASAEELLAVLEQAEKSAWWCERARELRATTHRPLRRIRVPRETAVYGRDAELSRLRAFYDEVNSGDGRVLLIEGEAGIGKTRLVDEFVARLQQDGEDMNFLFASYPPGGAATASGAFSAAYREQLGEHQLHDSLMELLPQTPVLVPAFAALLRGDVAPKDSQPLTKDALQTCFVYLTRSLAAERTTVVLIDDLHFAPEEGLALFTSVALGIPDHRVLLIGTMRPGVPEEWTAGVTRLDHATHLTVPRLGPKDLVQLLGDTFKSQRLAEDLSGKIAVKSDGNPFFAFEIIRGLREGQFITRRADGSWETTRLIEDIQVPSSVLDLVNARVAELDEDERNLLDIAACWGYEFDATLVAEAAGLPRVPALRRFAQIEKKHRLVRAAGRRAVFDHHQVQEALYAALPELLREEYHGALAAALETRPAPHHSDADAAPGGVSVELCDQWLRSATPERATRHLKAAQAHLESEHLLAQYVDLTERALDAPRLLHGKKRAAVLVGLVRADGPMSKSVQRDRHESRALELATLAAELGDGPLQWEAQMSLGVSISKSHRDDEAEPHLRSALEIARRQESPRREALALNSLGAVLRSANRLNEAIPLQRLSAEILASHGLREDEPLPHGNLGVSLAQAGAPAEGRRELELAIEISLALGKVEDARHYEGQLAIILSDCGEAERAIELMSALLTQSRRFGDRSAELSVAGNLSAVLFETGRTDEAVAMCEGAMTLARDLGHEFEELMALCNLGTMQFQLGDFERGRTALQESLERARARGFDFVEGSSVDALAELARAEGDVATAAELSRRAIEVRRRIEQPHAAVISMLRLADLLLRRGDREEAVELLDEALQHSRSQERAPLVARALAMRVLAGSSPEQDALTALDTIDDTDTKASCHLTLWKATGDLAHLRAAHRHAEACEAGLSAVEREVVLRRSRDRREIRDAWAEHGEGHADSESATQAG